MATAYVCTKTDGFLATIIKPTRSRSQYVALKKNSDQCQSGCFVLQDREGSALINILSSVTTNSDYYSNQAVSASVSCGFPVNSCNAAFIGKEMQKINDEMRLTVTLGLFEPVLPARARHALPR